MAGRSPGHAARRVAARFRAEQRPILRAPPALAWIVIAFAAGIARADAFGETDGRPAAVTALLLAVFAAAIAPKAPRLALAVTCAAMFAAGSSRLSAADAPLPLNHLV